MRRIRTCLLALTITAYASPAQVAPERGKPAAVEIHDDGTVSVRGRVVFTDADGKQRPRAQGHVTVTLWSASPDGSITSGTLEEADLVDGAFAATFLQVPALVAISIRTCRIDGITVLVEQDRIQLPVAELVFNVRAIPELRLRVVDGATGKDLDGVEVFTSSDWKKRGAQHPGSGDELTRVVEEARSPFLVPASDRVRDASDGSWLWVRAAGWAWQGVEVFLVQGGVRKVALVPGGSLAITLVGELPVPPARPTLRLYRGSKEQPVAEFLLKGEGALTIEGLPAGTYDARVELGDWFRSPRGLARTDAVVTAGTTNTLSLPIRAEGTPPMVTVRGTIVVPAGWRNDKAMDVMLSLNPLGQTQAWTEHRFFHGDDITAADKDGEYRFALSQVVAGRYEVEVSPGAHRRAITVPKTGLDDLRIEVPEPVGVVVRVVRADTKAPHFGARVTWHATPPPGVTGSSLESVEAAPDSNEIRFRAPAGTITLGGQGDDYQIEEQHIEISGEKVEVELASQTLFGVKVALFEAGTPIPLTLDSPWKVDLEPNESSMRWSSDGFAMLVRRAGRYVLRIQAAEGYEPVSDRQVDLRAGAFPTVEVEVKRKK